MIDVIQQLLSSAQLLTQEIAPGLLNVKAMVDQHPKIVQWRETEIHKNRGPSRAVSHLPRPNCTRATTLEA